MVCITRRDFTKAGNSYVLRDLPSGNYSVKVRATSLAGNGNFTEAQYFLIREYTSLRSFWILFWVILVILLIIITIIAFYFCKKKFMNNVPNRRLIATVNPEYVSSVYVPDEWEVPRRKIQVLKELGNGSFGMVYEGVARDVVKGKPEVRCAVKTVNENATDRERIEFLNEASVMKQVSLFFLSSILSRFLFLFIMANEMNIRCILSIKSFLSLKSSRSFYLRNPIIASQKSCFFISLFFLSLFLSHFFFPPNQLSLSPGRI